MLVGDSSDYSTLLQMKLNDMTLPDHPESLILPALDGAAPKGLGVAALPDSAQICSCHNVSKADIFAAVDNGCTDLASLKACTKAGTGCGGCVPLLKQVMEYRLQQSGIEVKKRHLRTLCVLASGTVPPDPRQPYPQFWRVDRSSRSRARV
ncbi:hypothetical protein OS11_04550 [Dickeya oryzae]